MRPSATRPTTSRSRLESKSPAARIAQAQADGLGEGFDDVPEILAVGPDLAAMHGVDAFGEDFEGLVAKDDAMSAAAEGVDDEVALAGVEQHDGARLGLQGAKFAENAEPLERTLLQLGADDDHVGRAFLEKAEHALRVDGRSEHADATTPGTKEPFDQLVDSCDFRFRDHDIHNRGRAPRLLRLNHRTPRAALESGRLARS